MSLTGCGVKAPTEAGCTEFLPSRHHLGRFYQAGPEGRGDGVFQEACLRRGTGTSRTTTVCSTSPPELLLANLTKLCCSRRSAYHGPWSQAYHAAISSPKRLLNIKSRVYSSTTTHRAGSHLSWSNTCPHFLRRGHCLLLALYARG